MVFLCAIYVNYKGYITLSITFLGRFTVSDTVFHKP